MTMTHTDPADLGQAIVAALAVECAPPAHLTTLAQQLAFYRAAALDRVHAAVPDDADAEYRAAALRAAAAEVGYIHAQDAGGCVADKAMIDTTATGYFGGPLSTGELARRKRAATAEAKRMARELLSEPLDPDTNDVVRFGEGVTLAAEDRDEGYSDVSPAVHAEVERLIAAWPS